MQHPSKAAASAIMSEHQPASSAKKDGCVTRVGSGGTPPTRLKQHTQTTKTSSLRYAKPFGVLDFLKTLFTKLNDLLTTPAQDNGNQTITTCFQQASMNFTHWVNTSSFLVPATTRELLHNLLFGQAALQLASNQKHWDLLIPIYLGKAGDDFDSTQVTGMLIQVKNSKAKNNFKVEEDHYRYLFDLKCPMITVLVDLGVKKSLVERVPSFSDHLFAFRVSGASMATYNCIKSATMEATLANILNHNLETGHDAQAIVTTFNDRYLSHDFKGRFLGKLAEVQVFESEETAEPPPLSKSEKGSSRSRKRKRKGGKDVEVQQLETSEKGESSARKGKGNGGKDVELQQLGTTEKGESSARKGKGNGGKDVELQQPGTSEKGDSPARKGKGKRARRNKSMN
jgi:hypothetical protein